mmetsp:Transcript_14644/g.39217  ORF Transcript_14644/g.39217 Transcript_14644/m.39217 type:complete len:82 (+) Transcript_14644:190-435(+)
MTEPVRIILFHELMPGSRIGSRIGSAASALATFLLTGSVVCVNPQVQPVALDEQMRRRLSPQGDIFIFAASIAGPPSKKLQ